MQHLITKQEVLFKIITIQIKYKPPSSHCPYRLFALLHAADAPAVETESCGCVNEQLHTNEERRCVCVCVCGAGGG